MAENEKDKNNTEHLKEWKICVNFLAAFAFFLLFFCFSSAAEPKAATEDESNPKPRKFSQTTSPWRKSLNLMWNFSPAFRKFFCGCEFRGKTVSVSLAASKCKNVFCQHRKITHPSFAIVCTQPSSNIDSSFSTIEQFSAIELLEICLDRRTLTPAATHLMRPIKLRFLAFFSVMVKQIHYRFIDISLLSA